MAAVAGDMRKALDVCRRAVEMAESEIRSQNVLKINGKRFGFKSFFAIST